MTERIITVEPYDPRYKDAALKLREILAGVLTAIHHIGSTANDKMHDMRSTPRGENGITGRRCCSK
ncbi:GrpB family protein [Serratia marcescens]|uniref:GrpB family protein n=1 Tax=Serratia marcescens TaxID=615 RepID=UPI001ED8C064|nr:GrpB family protein [Serratia marcescens]